jgi:flavin reductase (DIM6/NTAB) family NADH-FMN oxidoreductase RutF
MWEDVGTQRQVRHDPRDFRNALGVFPTGVCLVTSAPMGVR